MSHATEVTTNPFLDWFDEEAERGFVMRLVHCDMKGDCFGRMSTLPPDQRQPGRVWMRFWSYLRDLSGTRWMFEVRYDSDELFTPKLLRFGVGMLPEAEWSASRVQEIFGGFMGSKPSYECDAAVCESYNAMFAFPSAPGSYHHLIRAETLLSEKIRKEVYAEQGTRLMMNELHLRLLCMIGQRDQMLHDAATLIARAAGAIVK